MVDEPLANASEPADVAGPFDLSRCFSEAWAVYRANFLVLVLGTMLSESLAVLTLGVLVGPLCGGWAALCLNVLARPDRKADLALLFSQGHRFATLTGVSLLVGVPQLLGTIALGLPGVLVTTSRLFAYHLVVDRHLPAIGATELSGAVIRKRGFGANMMVGALVTLLNVVPILVPYGGWVASWFTMPLGWLLASAAYVQQVREHPAKLHDLILQGFEVRLPSDRSGAGGA
jgi:hypothetical protein